MKAFEVYDTETRSWTTLPTMPCKRSYGGVIWDTAGRLCLLGGLRQGGGHQSSKFTKNVNMFDTNQGSAAISFIAFSVTQFVTVLYLVINVSGFVYMLSNNS